MLRKISNDIESFDNRYWGPRTSGRAVLHGAAKALSIEQFQFSKERLGTPKDAESAADFVGQFGCMGAPGEVRGEGVQEIDTDVETC